MEIVSFEADSCIRGHHIYKDIWTPLLGEKLPCTRETSNRKDPYAVCVLKSGSIVGHLPRKFSTACSMFLKKGGTIDYVVTGSRRYSADLVSWNFVSENFVMCQQSRKSRNLLASKIWIYTISTANFSKGRPLTTGCKGAFHDGLGDFRLAHTWQVLHQFLASKTCPGQ